MNHAAISASSGLMGPEPKDVEAIETIVVVKKKNFIITPVKGE